MDLILIRHAKAFDRDPAAWPDDRRRPLTAEGREAFARVAKRLARGVGAVDAIIASPAVRAWQTARILHERTGWPEPIRDDALEPELRGGVAAVLGAIVARHAASRRIVVVGHEPHLGRMASWLLAGDPEAVRVAVRKGAAIAFAVPTEEDGAIAGPASLLWMLTPRLCSGRRR